MKQLIRGLAAMALLANVASAQTFWNSGQVISGGYDQHYDISIDNGSTWTSAAWVPSPPSPPWEAPTASYQWISQNASASNGGGNYLFRTFFDLTGYNAGSASLSFQCAHDNYYAQSGGPYSLNGGSWGGDCGTGFQFGAVQTIASGFVSGVNEIQFWISGDSQTDGLMVGNGALTADRDTEVTPEPASLVLLATGLIGVIGIARKRKR